MTFEEFRELQKGYKAFHFTGHGAYNFREPAKSALGLADGLLSAKQISQLDLSSYQLVCLAACETALTGEDGIPDEYVGLASAFLKAGAANVLSTLWPVDEIASAWMMIRFYQNLLAGSSPAAALKSAQQWLQTVSSVELADWIMQLSQLTGLQTKAAERLEARAKNVLELGGTMEPNQPTEYQHPYYWAAFTLTGWG
ncbi:MAG: CHAT domain-containing protein [Phormidesmis sp.]